MDEQERIPTPPPGIYPDVPMAEYLAWDAWSRSDIAAMEVSAEYCFWHRWEREDKTSTEQSWGNLGHTALLEPHLWPPANVKWIDGPFNKNPGKADKRDAVAAGYEVHATKTQEQVEAMVKRCREHSYIRTLLDLSGDEREISAVAQCPVTGLMLKARCDLRAPSLRIIGDLKTTTVGTDHRSFQRSLRKFDWHLSGPHYTEVFGLAEGAEYDNYLFIVTAQAAPFQPRVYALDPLTMEAGRDLNHLLRRKVVACLASGVWPAGPEGIESVGLNHWDLAALQRTLEEEARNA